LSFLDGSGHECRVVRKLLIAVPGKQRFEPCTDVLLLAGVEIEILVGTPEEESVGVPVTDTQATATSDQGEHQYQCGAMVCAHSESLHEFDHAFAVLRVGQASGSCFEVVGHVMRLAVPGSRTLRRLRRDEFEEELRQLPQSNSAAHAGSSRP